MRIVFDFCDTLHGNPMTKAITCIRQLYYLLHASGAEIYVVTATKSPESDWERIRSRRIEMLENYGLPPPIDLIVCDNGGKGEILSDIRPDLVIDDSKTVANTAVIMGFTALHLMDAEK